MLGIIINIGYDWVIQQLNLKGFTIRYYVLFSMMFCCQLNSKKCWFARGLRADLRRRIPYYISDFKDGIVWLILCIFYIKLN